MLHAMPHAHPTRSFARRQAAKDAAEAERAYKAERHGAERPGPFVDPQAAQDSNELLS